MKYALILLLLAVGAYGQKHKAKDDEPVGETLTYSTDSVFSIPTPADCSAYYGKLDPKTGRCVADIIWGVMDREVTCVNFSPNELHCSWFALAPTEPELTTMIEARP